MDSNQPSPQANREEILKTGRELVVKWIQVNLSQFFDSTINRLFDLADKADNNSDQTRYFQSREVIDQHRQLLQQQFIQHILEAIENYHQQQITAKDYSVDLTEQQRSHDEEQPLSLVDQNELEEQIAIGAMCRKRTAECSELLHALNQRLSVLSGGHKITDSGNPISPAVMGEALQAAIQELTLDSYSKILVFKLFDSVFMSKIHKLYELLNHHFKTHNVLPNLSYEITKEESVKITEQLPNELRDQANQASYIKQQDLFEAIRALQQRLNPVAPIVPNSSAINHLIVRIKRLQESAKAILSALKSQHEVAKSNIKELQTQATKQFQEDEAVDPHAIEIVGLLFEYMLNDQQLPDSIKTLLSYLHTPFLKVATIDNVFFDQPEHPARQLLNSLVAAGERWVEPNSKKSDVFLQIKKIVERVLEDFDQDTHLFAELAFDFNQYLRQHARRIRLAERRASQAAEGENKLKEIRLKVNSYLKKKLGALKLPAPIFRLLFEPWANYLAFNLLRFGSSSEQWNKASQVVDDIIWLCQAHNTEDWHDRKRVEEIKNALPEQLKLGFDTVGYDAGQGDQLIAALQDQQLDMPTISKPPRQAVQANIDEIDVAETTARVIGDEEIVSHLRQVEIDTWFEFDANQESSQRVKLAWSNPNTLQFMFVNRMGQQFAIKTGPQLAEGIRNGNVKVLSKLDNKPFFEKAMEGVLQQMQQQEPTKEVH